ncbi:30S ribosomal protein S7, partial [Salibacterium salarium]
SKLVTRLINRIMLDGKKGKAQNILYKAFNLVEERSGKDPMEVFDQALKNVMPVLEVKSRRVGGANYQVPIEVKPDRRTTLGLRWMVSYARLRGEKSMEERLANEILDGANNTGSAVKKREDTHRMAEANKAFAHYRW